MHRQPEPSHYDTLQVRGDATPEDLRRAYRRAAQRHHPDRQGNSHEAQVQMARINAAYAVLSDPESRARYDRWCEARTARARAEAACEAARPTRFEAGWPWGLVATTTAFVLLAVGTAFYKGWVPQVAPVTPQPVAVAAPR